MKKIILLVLILAAAGGGIVWKTTKTAGNIADHGENMVFKAVKRNLPISLKIQGSLQAKNFVEVRCLINPSATILKIVDEGTEVKKGDFLVELDASPLESKIESLQEQFDLQQLQVQSEETDLEVQKIENRKLVDTAQRELELTTEELEKFRKADVPLKKFQLQSAALNTQAEMKQAEKRYRDTEDLLAKEYVTPYEVEQERLKFEKAKQDWENAVKEESTYVDFTVSMEEKRKLAAKENAELDLDTAKKRAESKLQNQTQHFEKAKQKLEKIRIDLEGHIGLRKYMIMKADTNGIVMYGDPRKKDRWGNDDNEAIKVGQKVFEGQVVITIPDLSVMQVQVGVHESDITKIHKGLKAVCTLDSLRGVQLTGTVTNIPAIAESRGWQSPKLFYCDITLDACEHDLKPGTTVKLEILIEDVKNAVQVPLHSVVTRKGKSFVHVGNPGHYEERAVELGKSNDNFIEILSGLKEGEPVLLYDPSLSEGAASAESGKEKRKNKKSQPPAMGK